VCRTGSPCSSRAMTTCKGFLGEPKFWELEGDAPILKFNENQWLQNHTEEAIAHSKAWLVSLGITESRMEIDTTPVKETQQNRIFRADANRTFRDEAHKLVYIKLLSFAAKKFGDYQQSLGYVAGLLMLFFDAATVFKVLTVLNDNPRYLSGYWRGEATLCAVDGYVAMKLFPRTPLMEHLKSIGLLPETFVQKWFAGVCIHHLRYKQLMPFLDHFFQHGNAFLFAFFTSFFNEFHDDVQAMASTTQANELVRFDKAPIPRLEIIIQNAAQLAGSMLLGVDLQGLRVECFETFLTRRMQSANEGMWQKADDEIEFSDEDEDDE